MVGHSVPPSTRRTPGVMCPAAGSKQRSGLHCWSLRVPSPLKEASDPPHLGCSPTRPAVSATFTALGAPCRPCCHPGARRGAGTGRVSWGTPGNRRDSQGNAGGCSPQPPHRLPRSPLIRVWELLSNCISRPWAPRRCCSSQPPKHSVALPRRAPAPPDPPA